MSIVGFNGLSVRKYICERESNDIAFNWPSVKEVLGLVREKHMLARLTGPLYIKG